MVRASIPHNLQLAVDIFHNLFLQGGADQIALDYGNRIMQVLKDTLKTDGASVLDAAVDESLPLTLHGVVGLNMQQNSQIKLDWKKWDWFGPILLQCLKGNHQKYAPQIALILGLTLTGSGLAPDFLLNENVLYSVFGMDADAVMAELSKPFEMSSAMKNLETEIKSIDFSLVSNRSQKWSKK